MKKPFLLYLLTLLLLSCSVQPTGPSGSDTDKIYDGTDEYPLYLMGFSTDIITGHIEYQYLARLVFQIGNMEYLNYNTKKYEPLSMYNITAQFDKYGRKFIGVKVNDSSLTPKAENNYFQGGGAKYTDRQEGIKLYFGDYPNHIIIEETDYTPKIDTTLTFLPKFSFQNIQSGDTVNKTKNFVVRWDGITDEFAKFYLIEQLNEPQKAFRLEGVIKNDGEFIFTASVLSKTPSGKYTVGIERFEPYTIQLYNQLPFSILVRNYIQKEIHLKK